MHWVTFESIGQVDITQMKIRNEIHKSLSKHGAQLVHGCVSLSLSLYSQYCLSLLNLATGMSRDVITISSESENKDTHKGVTFM